jgi:hypothetical protein
MGIHGERDANQVRETTIVDRYGARLAEALSRREP